MRCEKTPIRLTVGELIGQASRTTICLPDFQRDFVWDPWQMAALLESIMRGYPIGTFLFLTSKDNSSIKARPLVPSKYHKEALRPKWLVVDGQQRIRTLVELLQPPASLQTYEPVAYGRRAYKICLRTGTQLGNLGQDIDDLSFVECVPVRRETEFDLQRQGKRKLIPVEFLLDENLTRQWVKRALPNVTGKTRSNVLRRMTRAGRALGAYVCPVEAIEGRLDPVDLANIFNLLNEAGTELNLFDLCVARLTPHGVKLRDLWAEATRDYKFLNQFHVDGVYILKVLSLIRQTAVAEQENGTWQPTCTKKDIKALADEWYSLPREGTLFEDNWRHAAHFVNRALNDIHQRFGVPNLKYLPYKPMIITLAAALWWIDKHKDYSPRVRGRMMCKLERWYWSSIFTSAYEAATDTKIAEHFAALKQWLIPTHGSKRPVAISAPGSKQDVVKALKSGIESSGDARYKAVMCLPFTGKAEDILAREMLVGQELQDHHIFPRAYLLADGEDEETVDNVVNRMLITRDTNQYIKAKPPHEYLAGIDSRRLRRHFLYKDVAQHQMSYQVFLRERRELLADHIWRLITRGA